MILKRLCYFWQVGNSSTIIRSIDHTNMTSARSLSVPSPTRSQLITTPISLSISPPTYVCAPPSREKIFPVSFSLILCRFTTTSHSVYKTIITQCKHCSWDNITWCRNKWKSTQQKHIPIRHMYPQGHNKAWAWEKQTSGGPNTLWYHLPVCW